MTEPPIARRQNALDVGDTLTSLTQTGDKLINAAPIKRRSVGFPRGFTTWLTRHCGATSRHHQRHHLLLDNRCRPAPQSKSAVASSTHHHEKPLPLICRQRGNASSASRTRQG